jgi:signal transduction histidine kinase
MPASTASPAAKRLVNPLFRWSIAVVAAVIAGALVFEAFDASVFKRIGLAHEFCYQREPNLIWLHVISDILIGVAYVSISATLAYLVHKASRDIPFNWVFLAFGLFIVSCGMTHFMEVWVVWEPVYWMSDYVKVVTATASVATAAALLPLVPKVFRFIEAARKGERRRVEIEQLNDELERFNYSVAHDLRAPLRGITGFGQALREDCGDQLSPRAHDYVERMQRSAAQMDTLISDLLKYATVGRQKLDRRAVSLDDTVRSAQSLLDAEIRERGAVTKVPQLLPIVMADATLLQVVFLNLISNAIKFVAPGVRPEVEITAKSGATPDHSLCN